MSRVRLIHWNAAEALERVAQLVGLGYEVDAAITNPVVLVKELAADPPAAVVIDLSRLPSQGRDLGVLLRQRKGTRGIPLVFAGGEPEKIERVRQVLPDAAFASWEKIGPVVAAAIAAPPDKPVTPDSAFAGYSGVALPKKLGIKANSTLGLIGAPEGFLEMLGELPAGVSLRYDTCADCDVAIWFARSRAELDERILGMAGELQRGSLWIAWAKRGSALAANLTEKTVREVGLSTGLVDYKICAIDETWSGLLFTRRKA